MVTSRMFLQQGISSAWINAPTFQVGYCHRQGCLRVKFNYKHIKLKKLQGSQDAWRPWVTPGPCEHPGSSEAFSDWAVVCWKIEPRLYAPPSWSRNLAPIFMNGEGDQRRRRKCEAAVAAQLRTIGLSRLLDIKLGYIIALVWDYREPLK